MNSQRPSFTSPDIVVESQAIQNQSGFRIDQQYVEALQYQMNVYELNKKPMPMPIYHQQHAPVFHSNSLSQPARNPYHAYCDSSSDSMSINTSSSCSSFLESEITSISEDMDIDFDLTMEDLDTSLYY